MEYNYLHIGKNLQKILKQKKLKVSEVADSIGIARTNMYQLFQKENINTEILKKIADEIHVNIWDLIIKNNTVIEHKNKTVVNDKKNTTTINTTYNISKEHIKALENEIDLLRELLKAKDDYINLLMKK